MPEIKTSYPEIGLEFTKFPKVTRRNYAALRAFVDFERGTSKSVRTAKFNDLLTENGTKESLEVMRQTVKCLQEHNGRYRGTARIEVAVAEVNRVVAGLDLCVDSSKLRMTENGQPTPLEGSSRGTIIVTVMSMGGDWKVTEYAYGEGTC